MMNRRVRTGCSTCRRRRVKCDETKPGCNRCRTANFVCEGYEEPRRASPPKSPRRSDSDESRSSLSYKSESSPEIQGHELPWRRQDWRQDQLPLYHHFVTYTVFRLFRADHVNFWRDEVAQMSSGIDMVYEALLAISAGHKSALGTCQKNTEEATRWKIVGLSAYGKTLGLVAASLQQEAKDEERAVLIVLLLLTYFECFMENPKGALRHLWAAIQLLRKSESHMSGAELAKLVPVQDVVLRLDFLAQKLVPYACSSLLRSSDLAFMHAPFWNRATMEFPGIVPPDPVTTEGYSLVRLVGGHNTISKVVWGSWYPLADRPHREELVGFHNEMLLWRSTSPATFAAYPTLDDDQPTTVEDLYKLPIPPKPLVSLSSEAALNIVMYNGYLGCSLAMIASTDEDPTAREIEIFRLAYQNLRICAGLLSGSYKPVEALNMGISTFLYHGFRRSFSKEWQDWIVNTLRTLPHEGLSSGLAFANTLDILEEVQQAQLYSVSSPLSCVDPVSPLGFIRERLVPMLMPRADDGVYTAFYLRYGTSPQDSDGRGIRILAKATWEQDAKGTMHSVDIETFDFTEAYLVNSTTIFAPWRQSVKHGWHGFLF